MADEKNQSGNEAPDSATNQPEKPVNVPVADQDNLFEEDATIDKLLMDEMVEETEPSQENLEEIDDFAEMDIDEFAEAIDEEPENPSPEPDNSVSSLDDSYLDDFDITADDDELLSEQPEEENEQPTLEETDTFSEDLVVESENGIDNSSETPPERSPDIEEESLLIKSDTDDAVISESVISEALTAQVSQLWAEVLDLKKPQPNATEEIEQLEKKLKRSTYLNEENSNKNKLFANITLGIAALASIIAIVALVQNSGLKSQLFDLNVMLTDMEDASAGPDITTEKILQDLKDSHLVLENNQKGLMTQLAMLKNRFDINEKPDENQLAEQARLVNFEKTLVETNDKIKKLSATVSKLQKRRAVNNRPKPVAKKTNPKADWSVNLVSFKQDWYARKKAAEFKNKGIPVKISPVSVKGVQWYRLSVTGFKTKYEADAYASRAKKALNLSSVWVTQN